MYNAVRKSLRTIAQRGFYKYYTGLSLVDKLSYLAYFTTTFVLTPLFITILILSLKFTAPIFINVRLDCDWSKLSLLGRSE